MRRLLTGAGLLNASTVWQMRHSRQQCLYLFLCESILDVFNNLRKWRKNHNSSNNTCQLETYQVHLNLCRGPQVQQLQLLCSAHVTVDTARLLTQSTYTSAALKAHLSLSVHKAALSCVTLFHATLHFMSYTKQLSCM